MPSAADGAPALPGDAPEQTKGFYEAQAHISGALYCLYSKHIRRILEKVSGSKPPQQELRIWMLGAIAFLLSGRQSIPHDGLAWLMEKAGYRLPEAFLSAVTSAHYTNYIAYLDCIYLLRLTPKGLNPERLMAVTIEIGLEPDIGAAEDVIDVLRGVEASGEYANRLAQSQAGPFERIYSDLRGAMEVMDYVGKKRIAGMAESREFLKSLSAGMLPYMYAEGALVFARRKATPDAISGLVSSLGFEPNSAYAAAAASRGYKDPAGYIGIATLVIASGEELTANGIVELAGGMGLAPDIDLARDVVAGFAELGRIPAPSG